jgi:hypothetical protein
MFTPAGVLKFNLKNTVAEEVLARLKNLLTDFAGEAVKASD